MRPNAKRGGFNGVLPPFLRLDCCCDVSQYTQYNCKMQLSYDRVCASAYLFLSVEMNYRDQE